MEDYKLRDLRASLLCVFITNQKRLVNNPAPTESL